MKQEDIINYRLVDQQISHPTLKNPGDVVSFLCAVQAQDYLGALWAIGLRMPNATQESIEQAIVQKGIIRTWPMRGTLHFVSPADVRWMLGLLSEPAIPKYQRNHGLNDMILKSGKSVLVNAFKGNEQMTRNEIYHAFRRSEVPVLGKRDVQRHIIRRAGREGLICFGSHNENQPTFTLLDRWVPKGKTLSREGALAEMARRYFTSHGPATLKDFIWWSGLKVSDARAAVKAASLELAEEEFDNVAHWMPQNIRELRDASPTAYLLPAFDEYLIGYRDRSAMLDIKHAKKVVPGGNGMFLPIALIDGRVVGTWKRTIKKDRIDIHLNPFAKLGREQYEAIAIAAERYGRFIGRRVILEKNQK